MERANWIGAPAFFNLNQACRVIAQAFSDGGIYLVGSSLERRDFRDVDVRVMLNDDEFARMFPNGGGSYDALWSLMCSSISLYLSQHSGLPIDFQIQQQTEANAKFKGRRHALGIFRTRTQPEEPTP